ncbi:MAG: DNA-directed RNA polymerase subunit omega [candidate division BRC1 bacterium ADurb.BinA364]|nr:MAG: DNA-directed RNA polymerase subunit omega [candidate division BRC1 bacterium ADurb.BinA364]
MVDQRDLDLLLEEMKAGRANYHLVTCIAKRVKSLSMGDRPAVEADIDMDPVDVALKELHEGKISLVPPRQEEMEETPAAEQIREEEE